MATAGAHLARYSTTFLSDKKSVPVFPATPSRCRTPSVLATASLLDEKICCVARHRPYWQYQKRSFM